MKHLLLLVAVFIYIPLNAQKIKFGKIAMSDIVETANKLDPEAEAAYLISTCQIEYIFSGSPVLIANYHFRIKVYKEEGEEYANFELPFYEREKVKYIEAISFNEENGEIVETKLDRKDIFIEETSEKWSVKKFAIPNVKSGTVIDVKYSYDSPYLNSIPQWYFQNEIPGYYSEFKLVVPKYFKLSPIPSGIIPLETEKKEHANSTHGEVSYTFKADSIPAIKDDDYVLNINDYRAGLKYEISSITYQDGRVENYSEDWNNIAIKLNTNEDFGRMIKKKIKDLDYIIEESKSFNTKEKIQHIYDYVINNYSWDKSYGIYANEGLNKLIKERSGNIGDINLLLINLLKKANLEVYPVVMKTRFSGLLNTNFPSRTELNYLIALVKYDDIEVYLDATSKYIPVGQLPLRATNMQGIIIKEKSGEVIIIDNPNKYGSQIYCEFSLMPEDVKLEGVVKYKKSKYAAAKTRIESDEDYEDEEDDEDKQDIEGDDDSEEEDDLIKQDEKEFISIEHLEDIYKPINFTYNESLYSPVRKIGNEIFVDACLIYGIDENPFEDEERLYPVFYNYAIDLKRVMSITAPDGYKLSSIPEKMIIGLEGQEAQFIYEIKEIGDKLLIYYTLKINKEVFYGENYKSLKTFYDMIIKKQEEKIIFAKV